MQRMPEPGPFQEIEQPFHDAERRVPTKCSQHVANVRASNLKELEPVPPIRLAWATESGLSILGTAILIISAYLGGRMTYHYGISVARMSKDEWRQIAEAGGANLPPK